MFQLVKMSFHQLLILAYHHCHNAPYYSKFTLKEVWSSSTPVKIINAGVATPSSIFPQHYDEKPCEDQGGVMGKIQTLSALHLATAVPVIQIQHI